LKFATISFGQSLNPDSLQRASEAATRSDLVVALGSTLSVYPACSLPLMAAQRGIPYVIINRGATDHDGDESVSLRLDGDVAEIFPRAVDIALRQKR
jgi:NAD-dependent deacetylase